MAKYVLEMSPVFRNWRMSTGREVWTHQTLSLALDETQWRWQRTPNELRSGVYTLTPQASPMRKRKGSSRSSRKSLQMLYSRIDLTSSPGTEYHSCSPSSSEGLPSGSDTMHRVRCTGT